ncbi:nucleotidyl transferase AbiEii/AbiGii toxin family protein [Candidatus Pacearchaeota archaeon]|nr:nucleotidyl transferase AbiEii/AbiGii toxin family protein [Candidatus Pacearchaeota archaeon]
MDEIKRIPVIEFEDILSRTKFNRSKLTKDYFLTLILYLIKDVKDIYFKGGTALNKIFLNHARLSEDIDFTLTRDVSEVKKEIIGIIEKSGLSDKISEDKNVDGFLRLVIHYTGFDGEKESVFIDLNKRGKLTLPLEVHKVNHFYSPFISEFSVKTLAKEELTAEKVAASIGRNKPRDHFDVYQIIKSNIPINMEMVKKKCADSGDEFSVIKMFNKAQTLKNRWDKDMTSLISEPISFQEVIQFLAKYFKLEEAKEKVKNDKR